MQVTGFIPSEAQEPILYDEHRIETITGGIQSGKSTMLAVKLASQFWLGDLYWIIGPDYEQCRREFGYLIEIFQALNLIKPGSYSFPSHDQCVMKLPGGITVETKSAKYPDRIAGRSCDGIILCEPGQMPYEIMQRSLERLVAKDGWLMMAGTLEVSSDWFADKFKEYQNPGNPDGGISFPMPTWSNTALFPGGRTDPKIVQLEASLGPDRFQERCAGIPLKPRSLVFPEFKSIMHVGDVRIDQNEPVYIGVDPGYFPSVYAVVFLQFIEDEIYVFDEIFVQHTGSEQIISMVAKKPYFSKIVGGAIDVGSTQHHGGQPDYLIWTKPDKNLAWPGIPLKARQIKPLNDAINRIRTFLRPHPLTGRPQIHISGRCRGLLSEFGACKPPEGIDGGGAWKMKRDARGEILLPERPEEEHCHAAKALIYAVVDRYGLAGSDRAGIQVSSGVY